MKKCFINLSLFVFFMLIITDNVYSSGHSKKDIVLLGFIQDTEETNWKNTQGLSVKRYARDYGVSLLYVDSKNSIALQRKAIDEFIRQKVDYIAIVPVSIDEVYDLLKKASDMGIQIIICGGSYDIFSEKYSFIKASISNDFYKQGVLSAQWFIANNDITDIDMIHVIELKDIDNINNSDIRSDGFFDTLISNNINIEKTTLETKYDEDSISGITNLINEKIEGNNTINIIFFHNEQTAINSIGFLIDYKDTIKIRDINIISVGASKAFLDFSKYGLIDLSIEYSPLIGRELIKTIFDLENKKHPPKLIYLDEGIFTVDVIENEYSSRLY